MTRPSSDIATYYDQLDRWNRVAGWFGYGGGRRRHTVHRALIDPTAGNRPTTSRIHDLIRDALPPYERPRLLDAGCGLGGTLLDLVPRLNGTGVGLTLSHSQAQAATRLLARHGLGSRVRIAVQSYDTPPSGPFDIAIAIESLAHSHDPARSFDALVGVLAPGGALVVVDDMPERGAAGTTDFERFTRGWSCPALWSHGDYDAACDRTNLETPRWLDLSSSWRPRTVMTLAWLQTANRLAHRIVPIAAWRAMMDSHQGGLALERLHRRRLMAYRMLIVRKPR